MTRCETCGWTGTRSALRSVKSDAVGPLCPRCLRGGGIVDADGREKADIDDADPGADGGDPTHVDG